MIFSCQFQWYFSLSNSGFWFSKLFSFNPYRKAFVKKSDRPAAKTCPGNFFICILHFKALFLIRNFVSLRTSLMYFHRCKLASPYKISFYRTGFTLQNLLSSTACVVIFKIWTFRLFYSEYFASEIRICFMYYTFL